MATFHPMRDRVLVRPDRPKTMTEGGIHLPEKTSERPLCGVIVAVGHASKDWDSSPPVKEGQRVAYNRYAGIDYEVGGETLLIITFDELLGILSA